MKLSKETLTLIKNFSDISGNLLIKPGTVLTTMSAQKSVMAKATVKDEFPIEFGIYDLSEFLGAISLFSDPDLEFTEKYVKIHEGQSGIKYYAADAAVLNTPKRDIKFPEPDIDFVLKAETMAMIQKTSSVLRSSDVAVVGSKGKLSVQVKDKKNVTANSYEVDVGETDKDFKAYIKVEYLKFLPGEYQVSISSKHIARFVNTSIDVTYFVALEADSQF